MDNMNETANQMPITGAETTPPQPLAALEAQSLITDALDKMHIVRIALLEAFNPIQGQEVDEHSVIHGAYKILTECEAKITVVDTYLGDA